MDEERKLYSFDELYQQHKKNGSGLNSNSHKRGKENPLIEDRALNVLMGRVTTKGYKLIELALAHPQELNDSFRVIQNVNISHYVKKYE